MLVGAGSGCQHGKTHKTLMIVSEILQTPALKQLLYDSLHQAQRSVWRRMCCSKVRLQKNTKRTGYLGSLIKLPFIRFYLKFHLTCTSSFFSFLPLCRDKLSPGQMKSTPVSWHQVCQLTEQKVPSGLLSLWSPLPKRWSVTFGPWYSWLDPPLCCCIRSEITRQELSV